MRPRALRRRGQLPGRATLFGKEGCEEQNGPGISARRDAARFVAPARLRRAAGCGPTENRPRHRSQGKGLNTAVRQIDRGGLTKGVTVEPVEPAAEGNLVTLTSADPTSQPILVHDVALKQAD